MSEEAPALLPLFRSEQQMRLIGVLFAPDAQPMSVGELADRAVVAPSTASREVRRLVEHGIAVDRHVGRTRLVSANRSLPWEPDLQGMLAKTIGVPSVLSSLTRSPRTTSMFSTGCGATEPMRSTATSPAAV